MFSRQIEIRRILGLITARYLFLFSTLFFANHLIPFSRRFTYLEIADAMKLPYWLGIWANFDGVHYLRIARFGYEGSDRGFFPLYPTIISLFHNLTSINAPIIGLLINQVFLISALFIFTYLLKNIYKVKNSFLFIFFILAYPTAFFYSAIYTESLFFLLLVSTILFFHKHMYVPFIFTALLISLTRIQGIFITIPLFFSLFTLNQSVTENYKKIDKRYLLIGIPFIGLILYMAYLYQATGDPLNFLTVQSTFGAQRSGTFVLLPQVYFRYFKIFYTASWNFQYIISAIEFLLFNFCFILSIIHGYISYKKRNWQEFGIAIFSIANLLLVTLTGSFSSITRYSLFAWSPYFLLVSLKTRYQYVILTVFMVLQCILFGYFAQGYFVG